MVDLQQILTPIIGGFRAKDGDAAVQIDVGLDTARKTIAAALCRGDCEGRSLVSLAGNYGYAPIGTGADDKPPADGKLAEGYFIFGRFHELRSFLYSSRVS